MKDNNYITILAPMISKLKLSGNNLIVFALIYGFSQEEGTYFTGSLSYICEWTNMTKASVVATLKALVKYGYINKIEETINNVKFCKYNTNYDTLLKNLNSGIESILPVKKYERGSLDSEPGGSIESEPNNIKNNPKDILTSIPPTPYQRGAGGDEEEYRYSGSPLPCGAEDRSGRASDAPKRKVAPKEKGEPWRESFDEYMKLVNEGAAALMADAKFRAEVEQLQPNVDYDRTIKWCVSQYWGTEQAWERKRRARTKTIDMKATLRQNFDKNRIYKERRASYSGGSRPRDVDTLHVNDDWAEILAEQERRISDEN